MKTAGQILVVVGIVLFGIWVITADNMPKTDTIVATNTPILTPMPIQKFEKLIIEDTQEGTGPAVKSGDTIAIHYRGTLVNGTEFDSSYKRGQPFQTQIGVGRVIRGWDEGVIGMKVGGKRTLKIPSDMGYGVSGYPPDIPPNADLIFEVELMGIK